MNATETITFDSELYEDLKAHNPTLAGARLSLELSRGHLSCLPGATTRVPMMAAESESRPVPYAAVVLHLALLVWRYQNA